METILKKLKNLFQNQALKKTISSFENSNINGISFLESAKLELIKVNNTTLFLKQKKEGDKWQKTAFLEFNHRSDNVKIQFRLSLTEIENYETDLKMVIPLIYDLIV